MPMYFDTLDTELSFLLAFEHKEMIWSWKVRLLSIFIPSSSSEELALIHEFCICIYFVSYGLIKKWLLLELAIKPFSFQLVIDIRFQKIYKFKKILSTNVGSGIICITGKINVIVNKK